MLAGPIALVAWMRTVLLPATTCAVSVFVVHVAHAPVGAKDDADCTGTLFTRMSAGRSAVLPLA
jgi:hypothetical protein